MPRLTDSAIQDELARLPAWSYEGGALRRSYTFPGFMRGIAFVEAVAKLAEDAGHHPDIAIQYTRVSLALSTHDAGDVTEKDVALAHQIEALGMA
jgi:4a-hydroxytetrahydrobiopterin dehydratase